MKSHSITFRKTELEPRPGYLSSAVENTPVRYSDEELEEFRKLILSLLNEALVNYKLLKKVQAMWDIHEAVAIGYAIDLPDIFLRQGYEDIIKREEKFIEDLKNALVRMENKTYGICLLTGKLIPKEKLKSVPHAMVSVEVRPWNA